MTTTDEKGAPPAAADTGEGAALREVPKLTLDEVDSTVPAGQELSLPVIGFTLAVAIMALIGVVLIGIGIFAWLTYPTTDQLAHVVSDPTKAFDDFQQAHLAWFGNIKDLIQLLVVSLLVPLLATIVGYIFGRQPAQKLD